MKRKHLFVCVLVFCLIFPCAAATDAARPRVAFYITNYISYMGRECSVIVQCANPRAVDSAEDVFQLRNQDGLVLAEAQWKNPRNRLTFRFTVTQDMLGGNDLSVWYQGEKVTEEDGYAAFSDLSVPRVTQLEPEIPAISLTIVCGGGDSEDVDAILAVLDKHQVKCTFFLGGGWLESHVEEARKIVAAGHEIGSHGYQHVHMTEMDNYQQMRNVITKMTRRCEELLGVTPRLFRAPYSETNQKVTALCRAEGQEDVMWSIDSRDWSDDYKRHPERIVKRVTGEKATSGAVIQFHLNGYNTAQVLDEVIPYYQNECGFQVVPVGELLALSGRELPPLPGE